MGVTIEVLNANEVTKNLDKISKDLKDKVMVGLLESGLLLKEEIKESIEGRRAEPRSVDTGAFLDSIESEPIKDGVKISSDVEHSVFLEFGTSHINERRHFRNSMQRVSPIIKEKVSGQIKQALK